MVHASATLTAQILNDRLAASQITGYVLLTRRFSGVHCVAWRRQGRGEKKRGKEENFCLKGVDRVS